MNRLPNMMVLDFCEFLKRKNKRSKNSDMDTFSLLFDESFDHTLRDLADEYLSKRDYSLKGLLHQYIDSEYFDKSLHRYPPEILNKNHHNRRYDIRELRHIVKDCHCCGCCERYFIEFLDSLENNGDYPQYGVDAHDLVNNVREALRSEPEEVILHFMNSLGIDLDCEIDFLEWLISALDEPLNIRKMPLSVFGDLVDNYLSDTGKGERVKRQLVKSFKQTDNWVFDELLNKMFPYHSDKRAKSIKQVLSVFVNPKIRQEI